MQKNLELLESFLQFHQNRAHSPRTIQTYNEILTPFLGEFDPLLVKYQELENYINKFSHLSVNTRNQKIACLKSFFKWLVDHNHRQNNPTTLLYSIKTQNQGEIKYIPEEDFKKIIFKTKPRDRIMYSLGHKCGLRLSEILGLTRDCLLIDHKTLKIQGKGNKVRYVPVPDSLWKEITDFSSSILHFPSNYLFISGKGNPMNKPAFYSIWRSRMRKLGMSYNPHALRHGCATKWLNSGANIREVQVLLGHSSIITTQRYTHIIPEQLRELVNKEN
jgi:integrase/recombinase XerD